MVRAPVTVAVVVCRSAAIGREQDGEGVVQHAVADGLGDRRATGDRQCGAAQRAADRAGPPPWGGGRVPGGAGISQAAVGRCNRRRWTLDERQGEQAAADPGGQAPPGCRADGPAALLGAPQQPPASASAVLSVEVGGADAGLGQVELDVAGGVPVAGQGGDDGAGLLVAGGEQERRRAAVALHADGVEARLGVGRARRRRAAGRCRRSAGSGRSAAPGRGWSRGSGRGPGAARRRSPWSGRKPVALTITVGDDLLRSPSDHREHVAGRLGR